MCIVYDSKPSMHKVQGARRLCCDKDCHSKRKASGVLCVECKENPAGSSKGTRNSCHGKDYRSKRKSSGVLCVECKVKPEDEVKGMRMSCYCMSYSQGHAKHVKLKAILARIVCNYGITLAKETRRSCYFKDSRSKQKTDFIWTSNFVQPKKEHPMCIVCDSKPSMHKAQGMCRSCYDKDYRSKKKAAATNQHIC